jgi:hypothetical protein
VYLQIVEWLKQVIHESAASGRKETVSKGQLADSFEEFYKKTVLG